MENVSTSIDELRKLPLPARIELVEELWDSIAADSKDLELTEAQASELDRRLAAHDAAPEEGELWSDLRDRLK
jgi:putative addiction module component (TIGR02574 family)